MTVEEFNNLELSKNNNVEITMDDDAIFNVVLYSGQAYLGRGEHRNYKTQEIIPAEPPKILINGNNANGFADFIFLDEVLAVELL